MKVQKVMTGKPLSCTAATNLAVAVKLMWDGDCGVLPVTDPAGKVLGLLTDRDICIALATRNRTASQVTAGEVMSGKVYSCRPDHNVLEALDRMKEHRVRRLPIVDAQDRLVGILAMNDVVLATGAPGVRAQAVIDTLKEICAHRPPQGVAEAAA